MQTKDAFVYCWTNRTTHKIYVGSHKGSASDGYVASSKYLLEDYKTDPSNFSRQIIAEGDWPSMRHFEDLLIRALWANNVLCYNKATGGTFNIDADIRKKMSEASKGKPKSAKARENMKIANQKKANNPSIIAKLKQKKPEGFGQKISKALTGRVRSASHCNALSVALKGQPRNSPSEKTRLKMSESLKGRPNKHKGLSYDAIYGADRSTALKAARAATMKITRENMPLIICAHCGLQGKGPNMQRWHMSNCKKAKE